MDINSIVIRQTNPIATTVIRQTNPIAASVVNVGVPGTPGLAGGSYSGIPGAVISADTLIVLIDGLLYPADVTNASHANYPMFVATQSGNIGVSIIYRDSGEVLGGSWVSGTRYYAGAGTLSTSPIYSGATWGRIVGVAKSGTVLTIQLGPVVKL